nr:COBW domain-containing protein 1-like isoform X1 [Ipomoea batatas]GMD11941.1 COBW domain-containing protein 1-like isoform X1 [Ipomoea batatas]GME18076.1 COBW domain-containing protein 1-like isoform X1 [Ipomoea batatas]
MASFSIDIATTFLGIAKRQRAPIRGLRATLLPQLWRTDRARSRFFLTASASSVRSGITSAATLSYSPKSRRFSRRFTASSATTSTPQSEDSDVLTKIPPDNRIPATIITGFLGSGKTTLLNHILTANHGKRIAIIENEFGEVDIDGSLVAAKTAGAEDIMMLNNGCLCCTVRGDLVRMIAELVSKKKGKFDHIVIETTGLANPAPIIQTFYAEDQVFNDVKLDGVVTLVDAKHAGLHLDEVKPEGVVNEAVEQIAYADRIIVNKTDLVGEADVSSLIDRIRRINQMAHMKKTQYGKVDLDYVLGIGGFDLESIVCEGILDLEKANIWLGTLLMERSEDIYRMKGLLSVQGMDERFVFQGVHDIFQGSPDRPWLPDEPRINKVVFIGKNLDSKELEQGFKACLL